MLNKCKLLLAFFFAIHAASQAVETRAYACHGKHVTLALEHSPDSNYFNVALMMYDNFVTTNGEMIMSEDDDYIHVIAYTNFGRFSFSVAKLRTLDERDNNTELHNDYVTYSLLTRNFNGRETYYPIHCEMIFAGDSSDVEESNSDEDFSFDF